MLLSMSVFRVVVGDGGSVVSRVSEVWWSLVGPPLKSVDGSSELVGGEGSAVEDWEGPPVVEVGVHGI